MNEKQTNRLKKINQLLTETNYIPITVLAKALQVSEMTIRRDFRDQLDFKNLSLVNGIIFKNPSADPAYQLSAASTQQKAEKQAIGKAAAEMIQNGDVIALDVGTTTEQVAKYLSPNMEVTVVCYSLNILNQLRKNHLTQIIFGGGIFHEDIQTFESEEAVKLIKKYRFNKAFISAAGVSDQLGVTCTSPYEVALKKAVIESSKENILIFDASKYNQVKPVYFADLNMFQTVITDKQIMAQAQDYCNKQTITLIKV